MTTHLPDGYNCGSDAPSWVVFVTHSTALQRGGSFHRLEMPCCAEFDGVSDSSNPAHTGFRIEEEARESDFRATTAGAKCSVRQVATRAGDAAGPIGVWVSLVSVL